MRHLATIQKIKNLEPIEGADRIELATIKDWKVVVQKGLYKSNELVVYFEIDSFLPIKPQYEFLLKGSKSKKLLIEGEEKEGIRLKTIRLRGQISQGLIIPLSEFENEIPIAIEGEDVSEVLSVYKYERPISACIAGEVEGAFPGFIPKTDEERIQNCGDLLDRLKGEVMYVTSKLDGTSATFFKNETKFGACSRNLEMKRGGSIYWTIAEQLDLENILPVDFAIQGEIVGPGIQSNPLKLSKCELFIYSVFNIKEQKYLDLEEFKKFVKDLKLKTVPIITEEFTINHTVEELLEFANAKSPLNEKVLQEGIVIRPLKERNETINRIITRLSFKAISNEYLLKVEE